MNIRLRLSLASLVLVGSGFYFLGKWVIDDLRPRYLATMEESMLDTANLLATGLERDIGEDGIDMAPLRTSLDAAKRRAFHAQIYEMIKHRVQLRVYVTDHEGIVLLDSDEGKAEGENYARWNDVYKTLRGDYGARATRVDPSDATTTILYVAAPIRVGDQIVGAVTVCKPTDSISVFLETAKRKIITATVFAGICVIVLSTIVAAWISGPIEALTRYANAIRDGQRMRPPRLGRNEIGVLGRAFEEMREAVEGKQYVEHYVQTLTHEMKSPLSSIRGAAELLGERMPARQRDRFLENIRHESARLSDLVERLLQLSAVEKREAIERPERIDLRELVSTVAGELRTQAERRGVTIAIHSPTPAAVNGDPFLLRQAVGNLLRNAVEFSPPNTTVDVTLETRDALVTLRVRDHGSGIPDYALEKVFDRFYSLPRPDTGKKSTGIGLTFVREVTSLHGGRITLAPATDNGTEATLLLPVDQDVS